MTTLEQLNGPDCNPQMIQAYVAEHHPNAPLTPEQFIQTGDLTNFAWLQEWWDAPNIKGCPAGLPTPQVSHFIIGIEMGHTFDAQLQAFYRRCADWCTANGVDLAQPAKRKDKPAKLLDPRERMAHARAHRRTSLSKLPDDPQVQAKLATLEAGLKAITSEYETELARVNAEVKRHYDAMTVAAEDRNKVKEFYAHRIAVQRDLIKAVVENHAASA